MAIRLLVLIFGLANIATILAAAQKGKPCVDDGQVYADGAEYKKFCVTYKCTDGAYSEVKKECPDPDDLDKCHPLGAIYEANCIKKKCSDGDMGMLFYNNEMKCKDMEGKCRKPGDKFPYKLDDVQYDDCTCDVVNEEVDYSCNQ